MIWLLLPMRWLLKAVGAIAAWRHAGDTIDATRYLLDAPERGQR